MKPYLKYISSIAALITSVSALSAQFGPQWNFSLERSASSENDFKGGVANTLSYEQTDLSLTYASQLGNGGGLIASFNYGNTEYEFDNNPLWDDVESIGGLLYYETGLSENWSLVTVGLVSSAYEKGADRGDSITWGIIAGGKYARSETFSWVFGVGYLSRLEEDALVLPFFGFEWQVNDRLSVDSFLGLEVNYDLAGDGSRVLGLGLDYELNDFRLEKDAGDVASRAIRPEGVGLYVSYSQQLLDWVQLTVKVTGYGESEFETRENGSKISTFKVDSGIVGAAGLSFTF